MVPSKGSGSFQEMRPPVASTAAVGTSWASGVRFAGLSMECETAWALRHYILAMSQLGSG